MRTAIIFSGQIKRLKEDAPSVIKNLIEPYGADVFMSVWSPDSLRFRDYTMEKDFVSIDDVISTYNPKMLEVEHPKSPHIENELATLPHKMHTYHGEWAIGSHTDRCWMMFYRIWRGNELRKTYEKNNGFTYDCVIRFRFEIGVHQPCPIITPEPKTIYIPDGQDHRGGVCDTTAIGDGESMDVYAGIYSQLRYYSSRNMPTHQESVVRKHLELNGINIKRFRVHTTLRGGSWNPPY